MAVSKRLRHEVMKRDNYTCRYCRSTDNPLTIDHVVPVALGGSDDPSNLVAACEDCNAGKSSTPADAALVSDVASDAMRWARAMQQAAEEFNDEATGNTEVYASVDAVWYRGNRPDNWTDSIDNMLKAGLPASVIVKMAEVAQNKRGFMGYRWAYFCGCCWARVRQLQERAAQIAGMPNQVDPPKPIERARGWFKHVWYTAAWDAGHRTWRQMVPEDIAISRAESEEAGRKPEDYGYVSPEGMVHSTIAPRPLGFFDDVDHFLEKGLSRERIERNVTEAMAAQVDHEDRWSYFRGCCRRDLLTGAGRDA